MTRLPHVPAEGLTRILNGYGTKTRRAAGEEDHPFPVLRDLGDAGAALSDLGPSVAQLCAAADAIHPVFAAAEEGSDATGIVNNLLAVTQPTPTSDVRGNIEWTVTKPKNAVLASLTISLLQWTDQHGIDHLGVCGAEQCVDVYLDTSNRRRFCSSTCLTRTKVAAYRKRQALTTSTEKTDA